MEGAPTTVAVQTDVGRPFANGFSCQHLDGSHDMGKLFHGATIGFPVGAAVSISNVHSGHATAMGGACTYGASRDFGRSVRTRLCNRNRNTIGGMWSPSMVSNGDLGDRLESRYHNYGNSLHPWRDGRRRGAFLAPTRPLQVLPFLARSLAQPSSDGTLTCKATPSLRVLSYSS
jgi:hypothetical protein